MNIHFHNTYVDLGDTFYQRISPTPVKSPSLIHFNSPLAKELGVEVVDANDSQLADWFSGNSIMQAACPIAMAYNGHQFGHFNPKLGDGRAIMLGQVNTPSGQYDIQLKGSGRTQYSRGGDGRSALGPVIREYLVSEAMHKLGVPTTRALAAVTTGEEVVREQVKPGGIITRVARSFIRVGTFQHFSYREDTAATKKLADYLIRYNYPDLAQAEQPYLALLQAIIDRQAMLVARWMQLGFIHGVMNTDNMSAVGETIDYGPCAFMDYFSQAQVYSSIDHNGRYAYNQQPNMAMWNLTRMAETLLPLLADDVDAAIELAKETLQQFVVQYQQYWLNGMRAKIGLATQHDDDKQLIDALLMLMENNSADFTLSFYYLSQLDNSAGQQDSALQALFNSTQQLDQWLEQWRQRLKLENSDNAQRQSAMQQLNPVYIPRNHQIEKAIRAAEDEQDFSLFHQLFDVLQTPYKYQAGKDQYMLPPEPHELVQATFCGT